MRSFDDIVPDIAAAIEAFKTNCPSLDQIVLWGLCDAASAALLYWRETRDPRVSGMVLLNPWVRSEASLAATHIKHYYGNRLLEREFWAKLARGEVDVFGSFRSLASAVVRATARRNRAEDSALAFQDRMALGMESFTGPILLVLSGRDLTAHEFLEYAGSNPRWRGILDGSNVERHDLPEADHTFSTATSRQDVESLTLEWLVRSCGMDRR